MTPNALLATLRDVEGVLGAFAVDAAGAVKASDVPSALGAEALTAVAPRLGRMWEALEAEGEPVESASLGYGEHALHLRSTGDGVLCIISRSDASPPAIRMAARLVTRRLPEALQSQPTSIPITTRPPPARSSLQPPPVPRDAIKPASRPPSSRPPTSASSPPSAAPKRPRFFRGRRIDD